MRGLKKCFFACFRRMSGNMLGTQHLRLKYIHFAFHVLYLSCECDFIEVHFEMFD